MLRFLLILFLCLLFASSGSRAQAPITVTPVTPDLSSRQLEIWRQVANPDGGFLSRELHQEFWAPLVRQHGQLSERDAALFSNILNAVFGVALRFQRESWASALRSARSRRVIYSDGYVDAKRKALEPPGFGLPYNATAQAEAVTNGDRLIAAAASGAPLNVGTNAVYITEEMAQRVLGGLDGSMARMARLMLPNWQVVGQRREIRYDDLRIAHITDEPFATSSENLTANGQKISITQLSRSFSDLEAVSIGIVTGRANLINAQADQTMRNMIASGFKAIGATPSAAEVVNVFRGFRSVVASARGVADGRPVAASTRVVYRPKTGQLVQMMATAGDSIKAIGLREQLEQDLRLLED